MAREFGSRLGALISFVVDLIFVAFLIIPASVFAQNPKPDPFPPRPPAWLPKMDGPTPGQSIDSGILAVWEDPHWVTTTEVGGALAVSRQAQSFSIPSIPIDPIRFQPFTPQLRKLPEAIANQPRALSLHETAGDKVEEAINRAAFAQVLLKQGKPEQALSQITLAESVIGRAEDPQLRVDLLNLRSYAYLFSGEYEKSIEVNREALRTLRSLGDNKGQAELYANLGWALEWTGDLSHALACYEAAIYLFAEEGNNEGEVQTRIALGALYQSIGEFKRAEGEYQRALAHASVDDEATILVKVAEFYQSQSRADIALSRYQIADGIAQSINDPPLRIAIWVGLARSHMILETDTDLLGYKLGYKAVALSELWQARAEAMKLGNRHIEAGVISSIGELHYWVAKSPGHSMGPEYTAALENFNQALPLMQSAGDHIGEIGILTNIGLVYDAWSNHKDAVRYYHQALDKLEQIQTSARIEEFRVNLAEQASNLYQRAVELEIEQHHFGEAFDLSERARARNFLDQLGNSKIELVTDGGQDFALIESNLRRENISIERQLHQELAKPGPEMNGERVAGLQSRLDSTRKQHEAALSKLRLSNPKYASFLSVSPVSLRVVQKELSPDMTVISYFLTQESAYAFVLTRDSFHVTKLPRRPDIIAEVIGSFRDFASEDNLSGSLKFLYDALIAPVQSKIRTPRIAIVPYGPLHELPFAALTSDGRTFLGDKYELFYLPSVSAIPYVSSRSKPQGFRALVLANDQEVGMAPLNYANEEAHAVASLFGTEPLLGDTATVSALRSSAANHDILHLIAHVEVDRKNPQFSSILLGDSKDNDGALKLNDIYGLNLKDTNLVVLSGCESQMGNRTRGDDIISLSRAFIYAGAPSVVGSLWSVDDAATQQLMVSFYSHLKQGQSKADALRAAQAELRKRYPSPYYWAGFVLTGDPGQVRMPN
jgi:CHAT domain-containing protein